jgi:hypothetical protein
VAYLHLAVSALNIIRTISPRSDYGKRFADQLLGAISFLGLPYCLIFIAPRIDCILHIAMSTFGWWLLLIVILVFSLFQMSAVRKEKLKASPQNPPNSPQ